MNEGSASFRRWRRKKNKLKHGCQLFSLILSRSVWFFVSGIFSTPEFIKMDFHGLNESLTEKSSLK